MICAALSGDCLLAHNDFVPIFFEGDVLEITGYTQEELLSGQPNWNRVIHPDDLAALSESVNKLQSVAGYSTEREYRIIRKNGQIRWIFEFINNVADKNGKPIFVRGSLYDTTGLKKAEDVIRESEEKFRNLAEESPNMIFINKDGKVVYANKKCEEIMGYKRNEFYSQDFDFRTLIAPDSLELIETNFARHMRGEEVPPWEYSLLTKKNKRIEAIITTKLISYETGKAILGIVTDITERKNFEEKLRHRVNLENLVAKISTNFINISPDEFDREIDKTLKAIGEFSGVDRSYLFLFNEDKTEMDNTHEWCADGIEPQLKKLKGLPVDSFPWWMNRLNRFENIYIPRVSDLPENATSEKEILQSQNIQSLIVVPITSAKELVGFLGFDSVRVEKEWMDEDIAILRMIGEIFINALERKRAEEELAKNEGELKSRVRELEEFHNMAIERELRLIELKEELYALRKELEKYRNEPT
ncbi:MAG: PAS domain S-box protein [Nitrospirota bacterium]